MKPSKLVDRMGSAERPPNGVSIREIADLSCWWDPQSPLPTGAITVGISELAMPSGPAGRPSNDVILVEIGELVIPMRPTESPFNVAHLGEISNLALRMWAAESADSGALPTATSKLVAPVSSSERTTNCVLLMEISPLGTIESPDDNGYWGPRGPFKWSCPDDNWEISDSDGVRRAPFIGN